MLGKPLKIALWAILAPLILIILILVGLLFFIDSAARTGIQRGGTYALGVNTDVNHVSVGLFSGRLSLTGLSVANPQGFKADRFLSLGQGDVSVSIPSLTKDTITVPTLSLDNINVNLERKDSGANYQVILDHLQKLGGPQKTQPAPSESGGKKLIINNLSIRHVTVHADLGAPGPLGQIATVTVPIDEVKLSNVGKDTGSGVGGSGVTISQLSSIIVQAVLQAAAQKSTELGPIAGELQGAIAKIGDLKNISVQVIGKAGEAAQQLQGQLNNVTNELNKVTDQLNKNGAGDVGKKVESVGNEAADKIRGLFGNDKDKKQPPPTPPKK